MTQFLTLIKINLYLGLKARTPYLQIAMTVAIAFFLFGMILAQRGDVSSSAVEAVLLVLAFLITSFSFEGIYQTDWQDGSLELLMSEGIALESYVVAKILGHWFLVTLPLLGMAVLMLILLENQLLLSMLLVLPLSVLNLTFLGTIQSALSLGSKHNAFLQPLLMMPLSIPTLIVSAAAIESLKYWVFLLGLTLIAGGISLVIGPFALRLSLK